MKYPLVLVNPRARRVARDPEMVARMRRRLPPRNLLLGHSASDLRPALRDARDAGVETLVVVGGDGTVAGVLTELLRVWPHAHLPALVLAGGGATNSLARALGLRGTPEGVLTRLLDAEQEMPTRMQRLLRIRPGSSESRYGLALLAGAPARWLDDIERGAGRGLVGRTLGSLHALGSLALGSAHTRDLAAPVPAEVDIDGQRVSNEGFSALAASTIRELGLAVSPFDEQAPERGGFQVGLTSAGAARLSLEVPLLTLGLGGLASCVDVREASFLALRFRDPTVVRLDTEPLPPTLMLTAEPGPALRIVSG